jgi:hypothetical protein
MKTINKHAKALHNTEGTNIHDSDCYQAPVQWIDWNRKVLEWNPKKNSPEAKSNKRSRENLPQAFTIANVKFKGRSLFLDRHGVLRCHCDSRDKVNMDNNRLNSHVKTGIHKKWEASRDEDQQRQAWIEEVVPQTMATGTARATYRTRTRHFSFSMCRTCWHVGSCLTRQTASYVVLSKTFMAALSLTQPT